MVTVRLYGSLKQFGEQHKLEVKDTAEIIRAFCAQIPQFRQALMNGLFKIRIGKRYMDNRFIEKDMHYRLKDGMTVHITPVIAGAKKGGVFQTILGAVMVVVGFMTSWTGVGYYVGLMGVSLMLGGVAQMLTKSPSMPGRGNDQEKKRSTAFSGLSNMVAQGRPIPLAYGRIQTGSLIISQGVETINIDNEEAKARNRRRGSLKAFS